MRKNHLAVLLSIVCLTVLLAINPIATAQDPSFKTPEEVITFYLQAVVEGDVIKIMQASAVNEMSENFRFDLYTDRLQILTPHAPAPSDYPFYAEINKAQFSWQILNQARNLAYGLLSTEKAMLDGQTVIIDSEGTARFIEEVDPEGLAALQVMKTGVPNPDLMYSERNQENSNSIAEVYGADELTERVVLFMFKGDTYYVGFTLLRYGEDWKINNATSPIGGTSPLGAPQKITAEEFEALISGN